MLSRRPAGHRRSAKPGLHGNPSSRSTFLQDGSGLEPGVLLSFDKTRYAWRKELRNRRLGKALSRSFHDRPFLCQSVPPANAILKSNFSWPQEGRWPSSNPSKSPGQELRVHTGRGLVGWPRIMLLLSVRPRTPTSRGGFLISPIQSVCGSLSLPDSCSHPLLPVWTFLLVSRGYDPRSRCSSPLEAFCPLP